MLLSPPVCSVRWVMPPRERAAVAASRVAAGGGERAPAWGGGGDGPGGAESAGGDSGNGGGEAAGISALPLELADFRPSGRGARLGMGSGPRGVSPSGQGKTVSWALIADRSWDKAAWETLVFERCCSSGL